MVTAILCTVTQEDQDKVDEEDEEKAMQNLVQTWLERLQLISVIVSKAMFYQAPKKVIGSFLNFRQHSLLRLNRAC
jgi:hypothetical protein